MTRSLTESDSFEVEGPDDVSVQVELELFPFGEDACDVRTETEDSHFRHFTCDLSGGRADSDDVKRVARAMATFLLNEFERNRGEVSPQQPSPSELPPHVPLLTLDENGVIQDLTEEARRVLEYSSEDFVEPNFFSHVHDQNLQRVMRDLAHMVSHRKQQARWLLRVRTGNHRWRWYRAVAENCLNDSEGSIQILLRPL